LHYEFAVLEPDRRKRFINDLETLLKKHPGHPFALMHMGLLSTGEVRKLIEAHKNVYFQLSMAANIYRETGYPWTFMFEENGAIGELRPEWKDILTEHPKRFLFAMDGVFANQWRKRSVQDIREWRAALGSIPQEAADLIAHKNAERLWSGLIR
jgi:predicted TIM-barrel fold metal-dependent hydrolase